MAAENPQTRQPHTTATFDDAISNDLKQCMLLAAEQFENSFPLNIKVNQKCSNTELWQHFNAEHKDPVQQFPDHGTVTDFEASPHVSGLPNMDPNTSCCTSGPSWTSLRRAAKLQSFSLSHGSGAAGRQR